MIDSRSLRNLCIRRISAWSFLSFGFVRSSSTISLRRSEKFASPLSSILIFERRFARRTSCFSMAFFTSFGFTSTPNDGTISPDLRSFERLIRPPTTKFPSRPCVWILWFLLSSVTSPLTESVIGKRTPSTHATAQTHA